MHHSISYQFLNKEDIDFLWSALCSSRNGGYFVDNGGGRVDVHFLERVSQKFKQTDHHLRVINPKGSYYFFKVGIINPPGIRDDRLE